MHLKKSCAVLLPFLLAAAARAQLNGSYTVGSGGNYATLAAAATDLTTLGVSGPVTFVVSGPQAGPVTIGTIPGQGAANPVYFSGAAGAATLTGTGTVLTLNGCQYVTFDGFSGTFTTGSAIVINGSYDTFQACNFTMPVTTATSTNKVFAINGGVGVAIQDSTFGGGYEAFNSAAACDQLVIQRNRIQGGGFWIGQILGTNVQVKNNFFYGNSQYGLRAGAATTNLHILSNSFYIVQATSGSQFCALRWYGTTYGEVINNVFYDTHVNTTNGNILWCSGVLLPTVMDYNVFYMVNGVGLISSNNVQYTLATWQTTFSRDQNSILGDPGYANTAASPPDLHVSQSSPCFLTAQPNANVLDDIDGQVRNPAVPTRGADEVPTSGLFANFHGTPVAGHAPLTVAFTDSTFTSDPAGVQSWSWDFDNDGITDSNLQNPTHTYFVPGTYTVRLTVTDTMFPANTLTRSNYIAVSQYLFHAQSSGGGVGNLTITPIPHIGVPAATTGYMLISFTPPATLGSGPLFGLVPDAFTFACITTPAAVGNVLHWIVTPGIFPNVSLVLPAGTLSSLAGQTVDFVQVDLTPMLTLANISNLDRVTF